MKQTTGKNEYVNWMRNGLTVSKQLQLIWCISLILKTILIQENWNNRIAIIASQHFTMIGLITLNIQQLEKVAIFTCIKIEV